MGRLIIDKLTRSLILDKENTLSKGSLLLLEDAYRLSRITPSTIIISLDLNNKQYNDDYSTMIIAKEDKNGGLTVFQVMNEKNYIHLSRYQTKDSTLVKRLHLIRYGAPKKRLPKRIFHENIKTYDKKLLTMLT